MRRFIVLSLAALLALAVAAPVAAGANVANRSGSFDEVYGSWSAYDESTEIATYGSVWVFQEAGSGGLVESLYEESGRYVECAGGGGNIGFQGTLTFGWGDATLAVSRRLASATATGTIHIETATIDDCAGIFEVVSSGDVPLSLSLTASGPLVTFRGTNSVKIPGELKQHGNFRGESRSATGSLTFGQGPRALGDAQIAHINWTDHCKGTLC